MRSIGRDLGDFFEVTALDDADDLTPPWLPVDDLIRTPGRLAERVDAVRRALPGAERRVAASVTHLGLVARLLAADLGVATTQDASLDLGRAWWQDRLGGPFPLAAPVGAPVGERRPGLAPVVGDITTAVEALGVSSRVLWAMSLRRSTVPRGCSPSPGRTSLPARPGSRTTGSPILAWRVAACAADRDSGGAECCLIYRVAGDRRAICGDCVLGV